LLVFVNPFANRAMLELMTLRQFKGTYSRAILLLVCSITFASSCAIATAAEASPTQSFLARINVLPIALSSTTISAYDFVASFLTNMLAAAIEIASSSGRRFLRTIGL